MDHTAHDRLYEMVKDWIVRGSRSADSRVDVQALADRGRVSVTPVREVLFRLIGERLVLPGPFGGFEVALPDAQALASLYAWNAQHLLAALHLLSEAVVQQALEPLARVLTSSSVGEPAEHARRLFLALGEATGNSEFVRQIDATSDRLMRARLAEPKVLSHIDRELRSMVTGGHPDVKRTVRRRLIAYHRRRIEQAAQIAALSL